LAPWLWPARLLLAADLGAYGVALMAAASLVCREHGWRQFGRVLTAFATMHIAWGGGFLIGAVCFADRWFGREPHPPQLQAAHRQTAS